MEIIKEHKLNTINTINTFMSQRLLLEFRNDVNQSVNRLLMYGGNRGGSYGGIECGENKTYVGECEKVFFQEKDVIITQILKFNKKVNKYWGTNQYYFYILVDFGKPALIKDMLNYSITNQLLRNNSIYYADNYEQPNYMTFYRKYLYDGNNSPQERFQHLMKEVDVMKVFIQEAIDIFLSNSPQN